MTEPTPRDLYEETDARLIRAEGLAYALYEMISEATCVDWSNPEVQAMVALADTLRDTIKEVSALHSKEWPNARDAKLAA